jgi:hypothetical protein
LYFPNLGKARKLKLRGISAFMSQSQYVVVLTYIMLNTCEIVITARVFSVRELFEYELAGLVRLEAGYLIL